MFRRRSVLVALATLLAMTLVGVQSVANAREQAGSGDLLAGRVGSAADGAALFRGVFFGQGDIGSALHRLPYHLLSEEQFEKNRTAAVVGFVDNVIVAIEETTPGFLGRFSTQMRSGDPFQVEQGIRDGADALQRVGELRPALQSEAAEVVVAVDVAVVHAGILAGAVAIAVAAVLVVVMFIRSNPSKAEKLEAERLIAELAQVLRTI